MPTTVLATSTKVSKSFLPVVFSTLGGVSPRAREFLDYLFRRAFTVEVARQVGQDGAPSSVANCFMTLARRHNRSWRSDYDCATRLSSPPLRPRRTVIITSPLRQPPAFLALCPLAPSLVHYAFIGRARHSTSESVPPMLDRSSFVSTCLLPLGTRSLSPTFALLLILYSISSPLPYLLCFHGFLGPPRLSFSPTTDPRSVLTPSMP